MTGFPPPESSDRNWVALASRNATMSYILSFVFSVLVALLVPVVPLIAFRMGASQVELGIIGAAGPLSYVPIALLSGVLSDRVRRRTLIVISSLVYALSCSVYLMSSSPLHLVFARMLDGVATAILWPAVEALLADSVLVSGGQLVSNFGVLWSSGSFAGGILSSAALGTGQYEIVFLPSVAVALLMGIGSLLTISEADPKGGSKKTEPSETVAPGSMAMSWALAVLYSFCQGTIFSLYPPYAQIIGIQASMIGLSIAFILAGRTFAFFIYRYLKAGFGKLTLIGPLMASVFMVPFAFSAEPLVFLPAASLLGVGVGLCYSTAIRAALEADPASKGKYAGLFEASIGLGYLLGPAAGGFAAEAVLVGPYAVCSLVALVVAALATKILRQ